MSNLKFKGSREGFKAAVEAIDSKGSWSTGEHNAVVYRTDAGAIVNWWPKTGTVSVQGPDAPKREMHLAITSWLKNGTPSGTANSTPPQPGPWQTLELVIKVRKIS